MGEREPANTFLFLRERGRRSLRNVAEPVVLYEAVQEGETSGVGPPIDPVCRMAVDPRHSAGSLFHEGVEYHFCSLACASHFAAAPERYVGIVRDPPPPGIR